MNTVWISAPEPPAITSLPPEQQAEHRTYRYGNAGFEERQRLDSNKIIGVAVGDSWFDYLPARLFAPGDILDLLNKDGSPFNIKREAAAGDTVENMVWGTGYWSDRWTPRDTRQLPRALKYIQEHHASFFLFSGGGNDMAGAPLVEYLNHVGSELPPLRETQLDWLIYEYFGAGYKQMIRAVQTTKPGLPIILHGYDYPVADGRGVLNFPFGYHFIGPWLRPAFAMKRIGDAGMVDALKHLIDSFNDLLKTLHNPAQKIFHIDLRGILGSIDPHNYKAGWTNELHPTDRGFEVIAKVFAEQIDKALHTKS
jgi:hypothetical protein